MIPRLKARRLPYHLESCARCGSTSCRGLPPLGGTLLQYVLKEIAGHFGAGDPAADAVLEMLFKIEDALIDSGELESDFMLIVAKPK